ncbi:MAG: response regulator [Gemmatimonadetes bacterium]|nr:response regulator [Gemmatimonadota bacterium]
MPDDGQGASAGDAGRRPPGDAPVGVPRSGVPTREIVANLGLAAVYAGVGILTLLLGETGGVELRRVIWSSSGLAAIAGLVAPFPVWWGAALGGAIATAVTGGGIVMVLGTGVANGVEVFLLVHLLRRAGFDRRLGRVRDVLLLIALGSGVAAGTAAAISVAALGMVGGIPPDGGVRLFLMWWLTHAMGILVITPVGLTLGRRDTTAPGTPWEGLLVLVCVAATAFVPFRGRPEDDAITHLVFLPLPFLQWAALRLGGFGAAVSGFLVAGVAMAAAVVSAGPLAVPVPTTTLVLTWLYANVAIVPTLITAALVGSGRRAEADRRAMQSRLMQSEKMESLGLLAGGIAHDFNNLLAAMRARAELIDEVPGLTDGVREDALGIVRTADEAAALCRQMLTYAGRGLMAPTTIDLSESAREMQELLRATTQRRVTVVLELATEPLWISADPSQVRQVVLNLVVNASEAVDAARRHGRVFLRTRRAELDAEWLARSRTGAVGQPGTYAVLEVVDDGIGMDEATMQQVFDPFYSSKGTGRGLGLSTVVGVVRGHRGALVVSSHSGRGTTFAAAFPLADAPGPAPSHVPRAPGGLGGRTVLVVDDDDGVRAPVVRLLRKRGAVVLEAGDGATALAMMERKPTHGIDLVLLDMTMPGKSGADTLRELRGSGDDTPVILASGFSSEAMPADLSIQGFMQKPFDAARLIAAIQAAFDQ